MARNYTLISSDSHLEVPPERWTPRVPEKYRERAPKRIQLPEGGDGFLIEGQAVREVNFLDNRAGRDANEWRPFGLDYEAAAGSGTPEQRLKEQDIDGIDAEILFPAQFGPTFWRSIGHDEVYRSVVRAYNDWLAEDYCSYAPDRLLGLGVIPNTTNVDSAIDELRHCKELGLRGVLLTMFPGGKTYPTDDDDKFWEASLDLEMPVTIHLGFGVFNGPPGPAFKYPLEDPEMMKRIGRGFVDWVAHFGWKASPALSPALTLTQLVLHGLFDRYPKLNVFMAEARVGWVPFWLESADLWYERHLPWAKQYLGYKPLDRLPSEYVKQHIYWSILYERIGVLLRDEIGVDKIMFSTDFPHIESEYPNSRTVVDRLYKDVPEDERYRMWAGNTIDFFKLAPVGIKA
jgi:uncharacterized protein